MKLAVIVPYRNRAAHLAAFVPAMARHLAHVSHTVHVVEQCDTKPFNRGKLLNVGYQLATRTTTCTHVVLHDVDMLPEDVAYDAVEVPTHLAGAASQFSYAMPYPDYFGGVTMFPVPTFALVNGFNNEYWGWGCEDDDLLDRCKHHAVAIDRVPGRFKSLPHTLSLTYPQNAECHRVNVDRFMRNRGGDHEYHTNGLSSLEYELLGSAVQNAVVVLHQVKL